MGTAKQQSAFNPGLPEDALWVLQITDLHLYDDPHGTLLGVNTHQSFTEILNNAIHNGQRKPDLMVLTGDLVHDNSEAAYRRLGGILSDTHIPAYCLPGNHDHIDTMAVLSEFPGVHIKGTVDLDNWRLILLNSRVDGYEHGHLSERELKRLAQRLDTDSNVMVCLHHQPVAIGSEWLDGMMLDNSKAFLKLIDSSTTVKAVIWGHIHQLFSSNRGDVQFLSSPSTCIQFAPGQKEFLLDSAPPACRMLALEADGSIVSEVLTLENPGAGLDLKANGY